MENVFLFRFFLFLRKTVFLSEYAPNPLEHFLVAKCDRSSQFYGNVELELELADGLAEVKAAAVVAVGTFVETCDLPFPQVSLISLPELCEDSAEKERTTATVTLSPLARLLPPDTLYQFVQPRHQLDSWDRIEGLANVLQLGDVEIWYVVCNFGFVPGLIAPHDPGAKVAPPPTRPLPYATVGVAVDVAWSPFMAHLASQRPGSVLSVADLLPYTPEGHPDWVGTLQGLETAGLLVLE